MVTPLSIYFVTYQTLLKMKSSVELHIQTYQSSYKRSVAHGIANVILYLKKLNTNRLI